ncbi:MAG: FprA family A-type flavoprotein [Dehalococcoidales bacterium]|nr:FprA family A-type flavoprotein [Dehalococcoidales bacterium]
MQKAIIIYETRSGNTKTIAKNILQGMEQSGVEVILERIDEVDINELADYAGVILGSPTYHKDMIGTMKTFLFKLEKANLKGKIGAAFGAWGWSGEAVGMISDTMENIYGMEIVEPRGRLAGNTSGAGQHQEFGKKIAEKILSSTGSTP